MTKLVELIQKIALGLLEHEKPMTIQYGVVLSGAPLSIRLSQKVILEGGTLVQVAHEKDFEWAEGDRTVLLRDHGGQRYLVIGKEA